MYLITGSAGYVAGGLIPELQKLNIPIMGIDRQRTVMPLIGGQLECDLIDSMSYQGALDSIECVIHLAAAKGDWGISEEEFFRDNVDATRILLAEGRKSGVKKWLFFSTVSALGPSKSALAEDAKPYPIIPYGRSKFECEKLLNDFVKEDPEAEVIVVRPSVVFGPENPCNTNIHRLIDSIQ